MDPLTLIQLCLSILNGVLSTTKAAGVASEITAGIEAAIEQLKAVHGSTVTKPQLESLRVTQLF